MAIEKKAVERAIRPAWRPGRGLAGEFLAGIEGLGRAHGGVGVDRSLARRLGCVGCLGRLQAGSVSVAIVGGRPEPARRPPGHSTMANIASQKKRILRSERERTENRLLTSTVKTHFRRLESAVEAGDAERDRRASSATLVSKIDKAVQKGAMHKNTGARKKSKAARIAAAAAAK